MVERDVVLPYGYIEIKEPIKDAKEAREEFAVDAEAGEKGMLWSGKATFKADELYYENGCIETNGTFGEGHYFSFRIPVTKAMTADIIEAYMKKLGRLKTLLEVAGKIDGDE